jgi:C4-dicarboxylate transporter DctM subunit
MGMNYLGCLKRGYVFKQEKISPKETVVIFFRSLGALIMPVIIIGGITTGLFTATEAGVVAVVYGFLFGILVTRALKRHHIPKVLINAATTSAMVMYIIAMATIFSNLLTRLRFQELVVNTLLGLTKDPTLAVLLIMAVIILLGCFIDPTALIVMFSPTLSGVGTQLGYDPIHFGVLMIVVMLTGAVTPPVGSMLFISCSIAKISIEESIVILLPFLSVMVLVALVVLFMPQTVIWIPSIFLR